MISRIIDLTEQINDGSHYALADISSWQTITIQAVGISGTMTIAGTDDGGEITGSVDGNPFNAANFNAVQATNLTTGSAVTAVTGTNLFKIDPVSFKYLRLGDGSSATATKLILFCTKPY